MPSQQPTQEPTARVILDDDTADPGQVGEEPAAAPSPEPTRQVTVKNNLLEFIETASPFSREVPNPSESRKSDLLSFFS